MILCTSHCLVNSGALYPHPHFPFTMIYAPSNAMGLDISQGTGRDSGPLKLIIAQTRILKFLLAFTSHLP